MYQTVKINFMALNFLKMDVEEKETAHQLLTCNIVRLVCAAMALFSSSVGYGC